MDPNFLFRQEIVQKLGDKLPVLRISKGKNCSNKPYNEKKITPLPPKPPKMKIRRGKSLFFMSLGVEV